MWLLVNAVDAKNEELVTETCEIIANSSSLFESVSFLALVLRCLLTQTHIIILSVMWLSVQDCDYFENMSKHP